MWNKPKHTQGYRDGYYNSRYEGCDTDPAWVEGRRQREREWRDYMDTAGDIAERVAHDLFHGAGPVARQPTPQERIAQLAGQLGAVNAQLVAANGEILKGKFEITRLNGEVSERDGEITRLRGVARKAKADVRALTSELTRRNARIGDLQAEVAALRRQAADDAARMERDLKAARAEAQAAQAKAEAATAAAEAARRDAEGTMRGHLAVREAFWKKHPDSPLFRETGWVADGGHEYDAAEIIFFDAKEGANERAD